MKKIILIALLPLSLTACWTTQEGEKIGVITKMAKQGMICKTWEGQIVRGGLANGSGAFGRAFSFTVEDNATAEKLRQAMEQQKEVKITYHKEALSFCRSESRNKDHDDDIADTDFFLDSFEVLK